MAPPTSILGHTAQLSALDREIQTGNVAHAYLFAGPRHLGKFTVAKWFAAKLLTAGVDDTDAYERSLTMIEKLIHPDLLVLDQLWMHEVFDDLDALARFTNVSQEHRRKAKAKTDTISIDDVRMLQERLIETGTGRYRVCLIRSAERMQDEAVNALLKVLEEPPQGVVFVLTTQAEESLLPTLRSRARVLHFHRLATKDLTPLLDGFSTEDAAFLRMIAQGAPGVIITLTDDAEQLAATHALHGTAVRFWQTQKLSERLKILQPLEKRGRAADDLLRHLALALRDDLDRLPVTHTRHLMALSRGLQTNASRPLLVQQFVLNVSA